MIPTLVQAFELLNDIQPSQKLNHLSLRTHCFTTAYCAEIIASNTAYLNSSKAYILGLLHDYGRTSQANEKEIFHGLKGYKLMNGKGFSEVARVCLTHSFPDKSFSVEDYPSYSQQDIAEAKGIISNMEYDDYDRLIQLADALAFRFGLLNLKDNTDFVKQKYNLPESFSAKRLAEFMPLKEYFDNLCRQDVYTILGI